MKVEVAAGGHPVAAAPWHERAAVRIGAATMTRDYTDIDTLTSNVSKMQIKQNNVDIFDINEQLSSLSLKDVLANVFEAKREVVDERKDVEKQNIVFDDVVVKEDEHKKEILTLNIVAEECVRIVDEKVVGEDLPDTVDEGGKVKDKDESGDEEKLLVSEKCGKEVKVEVRDDDEEDDAEEAKENGVLQPRGGPDRRLHGAARESPYKIQTTFNHQNVGRCTVNDVQSDYLTSSALFSPIGVCDDPNILSDLELFPEDSDACLFALTQILLDDFEAVPKEQLYQGDISPSELQELIQDYATQQESQELHPMIPTTITELEDTGHAWPAGPASPAWGSYRSVPSVGGATVESGYNSSCDSPSPFDRSSFVAGLDGCSPVHQGGSVSPQGSSCYNGGISPGYGSPYDSCSLSSPEAQPVYQNLQVPAVRKISPMPCASTLSQARARLTARLNEALKKRTWATVSAKADEELTRGDEHGDTHLMILLLNEDSKVNGKLEFVYSFVERLKLIPGALAAVNGQRQSALELAALYYPGADRALVTRYLAETLSELGADLNQLNDAGEGLLHVLCRDGDANYDVLSELIGVRDSAGQPAFNLDRLNLEGRTAIEEAVVNHNCSRVRAYRTVLLLVNAGASVMTTVAGSSLLDATIAATCDPHLVKSLLASPSLPRPGHAAYGEATALHLAAARNDLPPERQGLVIGQLVAAGWGRYARDAAGRLPLELVQLERREEVKRLAKL